MNPHSYCHILQTESKRGSLLLCNREKDDLQYWTPSDGLLHHGGRTHCNGCGKPPCPECEEALKRMVASGKVKTQPLFVPAP